MRYDHLIHVNFTDWVEDCVFVTICSGYGSEQTKQTLWEYTTENANSFFNTLISKGFEETKSSLGVTLAKSGRHS